jgi:hypothetical protein
LTISANQALNVVPTTMVWYASEPSATADGACVSRSPNSSAPRLHDRHADHELVEQRLFRRNPRQRARLDDQGGGGPCSGGNRHHQIADELIRIGRRGGPDEGHHHADEGENESRPLHRAEAVAGQEPARADHDAR